MDRVRGAVRRVAWPGAEVTADVPLSIAGSVIGIVMIGWGTFWGISRERGAGREQESRGQEVGESRVREMGFETRRSGG